MADATDRIKLMELAETEAREAISMAIALGPTAYANLMEEHDGDSEAAARALAIEWLRAAADDLERE